MLLSINLSQFGLKITDILNLQRICHWKRFASQRRLWNYDPQRTEIFVLKIELLKEWCRMVLSRKAECDGQLCNLHIIVSNSVDQRRWFVMVWRFSSLSWTMSRKASATKVSMMSKVIWSVQSWYGCFFWWLLRTNVSEFMIIIISFICWLQSFQYYTNGMDNHMWRFIEVTNFSLILSNYNEVEMHSNFTFSSRSK
jgi:hypothetical protein